MSELEKMMSGQRFDGTDQEIDALRRIATVALKALNQSIESDERDTLQKALFGSVGQSIVQSPFHCEFGKTIEVGDNTFINMNVVMLDGAKITIGDNVLVGPSTQFYTASHSLNFSKRREWETYCKPIVVEDDVWIGGNSVINQGVTIGARSVIAANSVVNCDVPPDCLYGGTPARLIRHLDTEQSVVV